jgi:hypothetical protein
MDSLFYSTLSVETYLPDEELYLVYDHHRLFILVEVLLVIVSLLLYQGHCQPLNDNQRVVIENVLLVQFELPQTFIQYLVGIHSIFNQTESDQ